MILEQTHTVRVSCCRLVTSNESSKRGPTVQLCLLPTEHMAVLVDATEAKEMEEMFVLLSLSHTHTQTLFFSLPPSYHNRFPGGISRTDLAQPAYIDNIQAKVRLT